VWSAINTKVNQDIVLAGARHALTMSSKGQMARSRGYQVQTDVTVAGMALVCLKVVSFFSQNKFSSP